MQEVVQSALDWETWALTIGKELFGSGSHATKFELEGENPDNRDWEVRVKYTVPEEVVVTLVFSWHDRTGWRLAKWKKLSPQPV
ncbi:MAG: hypothetical protein J5J00_17400 [Deltaproteobacteria bacterium]|nr:hypothetical protein [Deltaproteobacteria bacterium]